MTVAGVAIAAAAFGLAPAANAVVIVNGFTLDDGSFGAQTGVHADVTKPDGTLVARVNQDNSTVTFASTGNILSFGNGGGEATISASSPILTLDVAFGTAWDKVTFNLDGAKTTSFTLLVNGSTLFSSSPNPGDAVCTICVLGPNGKFTISGSGISTLAFTFDPSVSGLKQFRVDDVSAVPEPATWALMIGGLGLTGAALRRRAVKIQFA